MEDLEKIRKIYENDLQVLINAAKETANDPTLPPIDSFDTFIFKDTDAGQDVLLSGDAISAFLKVSNEMDALEIENFESVSYNEFRFDIVCAISSSYNETEDGEWEFNEAHIYRSVADGTYRRAFKKETFYEIPKVFRSIPDVDIEKMFMLFTDSNASIDVIVEYNETGGWRNEDDDGWAQEPDLVIEQIEKIMLYADNEEKDIKDILPKDCIELIREMIDGAMDEYRDQLIGNYG